MRIKNYHFRFKQLCKDYGVDNKTAAYGLRRYMDNVVEQSSNDHTTHVEMDCPSDMDTTDENNKMIVGLSGDLVIEQCWHVTTKKTQCVIYDASK